MLVRLYRCLPESWRKSIYTLFLGKILFFIRHPKLVGQNIQLKHQFRHYLPLFCGQTGIEIGGPSAIFAKGQLFPVYEVCKRVDGCNFASVTVWEGEIKDTIYRYQETALGWQYIGEATEMPTMVPSGTYDFVISSGCLEHVANPIKALKAWLDILKSGGILLLVVPNKKTILIIAVRIHLLIICCKIISSKSPKQTIPITKK